MPGKPRFLAENLFNAASQFGDHEISANEQTTGNEAFRVADNRRTKTFWTPTTANSSAWVKVDAGSGSHPFADMIVIDRASNLEGEQITLEGSANDTNWSQVFQTTLPTSESTDGDLSASSGVLTTERAWMRRFTSNNLLFADAGPAKGPTTNNFDPDWPEGGIAIADLGLEVGDTVSVSADYKSATGSDRVQVRLVFRDASNTVLDAIRGTVVQSSTFERSTVEDVQIPASTEELVVSTRNQDGTEEHTGRRAMLNKGDTALSFEVPNRARYWRLTVSAMGAGLKPNIYGLWLGESWQPNFYTRLPFTWGERRLVGSETTSDVGWRGLVNTNERREAGIGLRLKSESEYDTARYHIEELYLSGEPMWIVFDEDRAERSWLSRISPGRTGFEVPESGWGFQQIRFPAVEYQAATD